MESFLFNPTLKHHLSGKQSPMDSELDSNDSVSLADNMEEEPIEEVESKEQIANQPQVSPKIADTLPVALTETLPDRASELIRIFKQTIMSAYKLRHPLASAQAMQSIREPIQHKDLRQHLFAINCLQGTLSMLERCQSVTHVHLQTTALLWWGHQALEQGMTAKVHKCDPTAHYLPHKLTELMSQVGLNLNNSWAQEDNCGTKYLRYPFFYVPSNNTANCPLALQHIISPLSHDSLLTTRQLHIWLTELVAITTSLQLAHQTEPISTQLLNVIHQLSAKLLETPKPELNRGPVTTQHLSRLNAKNLDSKAAELKSIGEAMKKILPEMSWNWDPFFKRKLQLLKNVLHHLNYLSELLPFIKQCPDQQYLFLHVLFGQFLTHSLAENIGRHQSLVEYAELDTHRLQIFCSCYDLDKGLSKTSQILLKSIDIGKGNEFLYKKFPRAADKEQYVRMKWVSDLHQLALAEKDFTPVGQKAKSITDWQQTVVDDLLSLADLSIALVKNNLLQEQVQLNNSLRYVKF